MFSFMKIATFAALAFGTLASAIPAPAPAPLAEAGALEARQSQDVTTILTNLNNDLKAPCADLGKFPISFLPSFVFVYKFTAAVDVDVSVDVVVELVAKIKVIIDAAVTACGSASGLGSGNILVLLSVVIKVCKDISSDYHPTSERVA